jgi:hypothetical protein
MAFHNKYQEKLIGQFDDIVSVNKTPNRYQEGQKFNNGAYTLIKIFMPDRTTVFGLVNNIRNCTHSRNYMPFNYSGVTLSDMLNFWHNINLVPD